MRTMRVLTWTLERDKEIYAQHWLHFLPTRHMVLVLSP